MLAHYPFEGVFQIVTFGHRAWLVAGSIPEHAKIQKEIYEKSQAVWQRSGSLRLVKTKSRLTPPYLDEDSDSRSI